MIRRIFTRGLLIERGIQQPPLGKGHSPAAYEIAQKAWDWLQYKVSGNTMFNYSNSFKGTGRVMNFKSRTSISPEMAQDLWAFHPQINPENELCSLISENVQAETMRAVFLDLIKRGNKTRNLLIEKSGMSSRLNESPTKTTKDKFLNYLSNISDRDDGYFLLCSAEISQYLDDSGKVSIVQNLEESKYAMGFEWFGNFKERKIFRDPYLPADTCALVKGVERTKYNVDFNYSNSNYDPHAFVQAFMGHIISAEIPVDVKCKAFKIIDIQQYPPYGLGQ